MPLSDSQFIDILISIIIATISIIGTGVALAYRIGKKSGEITTKIDGLQDQVNKIDSNLKDQVNKDDARLTYIERLFMNITPEMSKELIKRFSLRGEKQEE